MMVDEARKGDWGQDVLHLDDHMLLREEPTEIQSRVFSDGKPLF